MYYQPEELAEKEARRMGFEPLQGFELVVTSGRNPVCVVFPAPEEAPGFEITGSGTSTQFLAAVKENLDRYPLNETGAKQ